MPLGRSSGSSKVYPAVEIPVRALRGIKKYPLRYFFTLPRKYFLKFLGWERCELSPRALSRLLLKKPMSARIAGVRPNILPAVLLSLVAFFTTFL